MLARLHSSRLAGSLLALSAKYATNVSHNSKIPLGQDISYMDAIKLNGLLFHGYHGVLVEERTLGQKFRVDAVLYCGKDGLMEGGRTDDLNATVNYADTYRRIQSIVEGKPHQLIETVAEQIAAAVLQDHRLVRAARIHVAKPHVSLPGPLESVQVEVLRWQQEQHAVDW